jgi:PKD repeat protein
MLNKTPALFTLFFLLSLVSFSQGGLQCGSDEMRINTLKSKPKVAQAVIERDIELEKYTALFHGLPKSQNADTPLYVIPVVFHVIHDYGEENISEAQIRDGIQILNNTFRKQAADTADIIAAFKPTHADCQIEFRLAKKDPQGNCHSGINRIASSFTSIGDHSVKTLIHWDPSKYLNIYVAKEAAGLAGHAVWPSDADTIPEWDGIVMSHEYVGSIGTSSPGRSVVLAHECGHYLNLHHIWGGNNVPGFYYYPCADPNKDCSIDDLVDDTPPTIGWQSCNLAGASCGNTVDMVQNAMDYSYCNIMFTFGQRDRMHACLNSPIAHRNNLWQLENLMATGVWPEEQNLCKAEFTSDNSTACVGTPFQFQNLSYAGTIDSVLWSLPGGNPNQSTEFNPTVTYASAGKFPVTLKAFANGLSYETTKPNFVTSLPDETFQPYPYTESFEDQPSLDGSEWFEVSSDSLSHFQITTASAASGNASILLQNFDSQFNTRDELISPMIDLSGATQVNLAFKYAYAPKDPNSKDQLLVYVSKNCATNWFQRLNLTASNLFTAPAQQTPFVPSAADWKQVSINIPSSYFQPKFKFKFVYLSKGGNDFFLDDINLDAAASLAENQLSEDIILFPNPTNSRFQATFSLSDPQPINYTIYNSMGVEMEKSTIPFLGNSGQNSLSFLVESFPNGLYFLKLSNEYGQSISPFLVGE